MRSSADDDPLQEFASEGIVARSVEFVPTFVPPAPPACPEPVVHATPAADGWVTGWAQVAARLWARSESMAIPPLRLSMADARGWVAPFACGLAVGLFPWVTTQTAEGPPAIPAVVVSNASMVPLPTHLVAAVARESATPSATRPAAAASDRPAQHASTPAPVAAPPNGFRGSLSVSSVPNGASVFVNGQPLGRTPLTLSNQLVGSRAVRVVLEGYDSWSSGIRVVADQRTFVTARLAQTSRP